MVHLLRVLIGSYQFLGIILYVLILDPSPVCAQPKLPNRVAYGTAGVAMEHFKAGLLEDHTARDVVANGISQLKLISEMDVEMFGIWPPDRTEKFAGDARWELQQSLRNFYPDYYRLLELESTVWAIRQSANKSGKYEDLLLFRHPEFRESLQITKVQAERLAVIEKKIDDRLAETVAAAEKRVRELLREHYANLRESLNDEQLDWWDEIVGEPIVLHEKTRLLDVTGEISSRQTRGFAKYDGDFQMKLHEVFYDEDVRLKPSEINVDQSVCDSFLMALLQFPNEIDQNKVARIKRRLLKNTDLGFQEFTIGNERQMMLDDPDFQYPAAIVEILSPAELERMRQLEFQWLVGGEVTTYGLRWAKESRRLSTDDWAKVTEAVNQVEQKIAQELRDFAIEVRDVLHEAYVACEQDLTTAQIQALGLVTSEYDIAGWLSGAVKTENVEETVRKLRGKL